MHINFFEGFFENSTKGDKGIVMVTAGFFAVVLLGIVHIYIRGKHRNGEFSRLEMAVSMLGIYIFFLPFGISQELIYVNPDMMKSTFDVTLFLALAVTMTNAVIAFIAWCIFGREHSLNYLDFDLTSWAGVASGLHMIALFEALKYLVYPTALLALACRLIPLSNLTSVRRGHFIGLLDCVFATLVGAGLLVMRSNEGLLTWGDGRDAKYGTMLLMVAMLLQAMAEVQLDELKAKKPENMQVQAFYMATWRLITVAVAFILNGANTNGGLLLCKRNPQLHGPLAILCFCFGIGQLFENYCCWHFSSVVACGISSSRKLVSVVLSVLLFGYDVTRAQFFGGLLMFAGVAGELFRRSCCKDNVF